MQKTTLFLVRHGQSVFNAQKRVQGKSVDAISILSEQGIKQAVSRANDLAKVRFDACFCSPAPRCLQTAEILNASRSIPLITVPELQEKDQGTSVGGTRKELFAGYPSWDAMTEDQRLDMKANPSEESQRELRDRALGVLGKIARENTTKSILIVTHGGFMRALYTFLARKTLRDMWQFENCGYMELEYVHGQFTIVDTVGLSLKTVEDIV